MSSDAFGRLQSEGPQTGLALDDVTFEERSQVRKLAVHRRQPSRPTSDRLATRFTDVMYLPGQERAAVARFVEANAANLAGLDYTRRNPVESNLSREVYDAILDAIGQRRTFVYPTVVREDRSDGTQWFLDREIYDASPSRRYTIQPGRARLAPTVSILQCFHEAPRTITAADLDRDRAVEGDARQVLDYFRACATYPCTPTTTAAGDLAVEKRDGAAPICCSEREFATTYTTESEPEPWRTVRRYRDAIARLEHSTRSPWQIAKGVEDETTDRVYGWLARGKTPRVVTALREAERRGLLPLAFPTDTFRAINRLVAWIFAGGSITAHPSKITPRFSVDRRERLEPVLDTVFEALDLEYRVISTGRTDRATEVEPAEASSVLGRLLWRLGAPRGEKARTTTVLPAYLNAVPVADQADFAAIYLLNRGAADSAGENSGWLRLQERRLPTYLRLLGEFMARVAGEPVRWKGENIYVSDAATRAIVENSRLRDAIVADDPLLSRSN